MNEAEPSPFASYLNEIKKVIDGSSIRVKHDLYCEPPRFYAWTARTVEFKAIHSTRNERNLYETTSVLDAVPFNGKRIFISFNERFSSYSSSLLFIFLIFPELNIS